MGHARAKLTPEGRLLLIQRIELHGWSIAAAADAQGVARGTAYKWMRRHREGGIAALADRASRPHRPAGQLSSEQEAMVCAVRRETGQGPHRLAWLLGMSRSTIYKVLRRNGLQRLDRLDRPTRSVIRYERERPGELLHLDVKKFARIPFGGGKRLHPEFASTGIAPHTPGRRGHGYDVVHVAVDDHSRYAYAEVLPNEQGATTAGFLQRAVLALAAEGITVRAILTDNGASYRRSRAFRDTVAA